jgi:hypothetical protein
MPDILEMLTAERDKLNRAIEALGGQVGSAIIRLTKAAKPGKRTVSAAARAKMAAAQRARWAKVKGPAASSTTPKKKYTLSPQARANIAAGARARWAKIKAGK